MSVESKSNHILELSKELLDDLELNRLTGEALILKVTRLSRYVGTEEIRSWLSYEVQGYNNSDSIAKKYLNMTGRWINKEEGKAYYGPLAQIEALIESQKLKLSVMRIPDTSGDRALLAVRHMTESISLVGNIIPKLSGVRSRVWGLLHKFVSEVYYTKIFDSLSESIFDQYKNEVDSLIAEYCGSVLEQIPSVVDRLSENTPEAVSQALMTCRRIIDSFADSIFAPSDETMEIGGNILSLKADKYQNRINAFIHLNCDSTSQKKKLRQNLSNLYERVSTGVHSEVTEKEARALFLNTYLILGEVLNLKG
ncbi:hypothetical protein BK146_30350 [Paenibacillus sp. FSL R7-0333]|nr:hypothetical protein BK146_30350 [Paenibacillus sp. FSL R7-0333]